jgi:hypothetical protein
MSQSSAKNRRRNILIDREFQLRYIGRFSSLLLFYFLLFLMLSVVAPVGFSLLTSQAESAMMETAFRIDVLLRLVLAPLVCTFLCLFAHGVIETFRVAGPSYRIRQVSKAMGELRLHRGVKIRKDDYLQDTCDALDRGLKQVTQVLEEAKEQCQVVAQEVEELSTRRDVPAQLVLAVERMQASLGRITLLPSSPGDEQAASAEESSISEKLATQPEPEGVAEGSRQEPVENR